MNAWQRTIEDQLTGAGLRGSAAGRDMQFVNDALVSFRDFCERYDKLYGALDSVVQSGIIGGHDHPLEICKCGQCGIRRLVNECKEAGNGH